MATDRFKAHCSVRGWIFISLSGGGMSADCSVSLGGGGVSVERSADSPSMTIELEMKLILIVCTTLHRTGEGKCSRMRKKKTCQ